jgi:hypothetical protein
MPSGGAIVARADRNQQQLPFPLITPAMLLLQFISLLSAFEV